MLKNGETERYPELKKHHAILTSFRHIADELTLSAENDIILKGNRIVLPYTYQRVTIKLAHSGHMGVVKTKALLRFKVYFPDMDAMVAEETKCCLSCQAFGKPNLPVKLTPTPKATWETVNLGPLPNGRYIFVLIFDQHLKYPVVHFVRNTSAESLMPNSYKDYFDIWNTKR